MRRSERAARMVEDRIDDRVGSEPPLRVFDAELATEQLCGLTLRVLDHGRAAPGADCHRAARHGLANYPPAERERVLAVLCHLRRIDQAVVGLAADLGLRVPQAAGRPGRVLTV